MNIPSSLSLSTLSFSAFIGFSATSRSLIIPELSGPIFYTGTVSLEWSALTHPESTQP